MSHGRLMCTQTTVHLSRLPRAFTETITYLLKYMKSINVYVQIPLVMMLTSNNLHTLSVRTTKALSRRKPSGLISNFYEALSGSVYGG